MSMADRFGKRSAGAVALKEVPRLEIPSHLRNGDAPPSLEEQTARLERDIREAHARGDAAVAEARKPPPEPLVLTPTAANIFANNALDLLRKREDILGEAIMRAQELEQLAQEMLSCGTRVQDFMAHSRRITAAVVEAKPAMALTGPSEPKPEADKPSESTSEVASTEESV